MASVECFPKVILFKVLSILIRCVFRFSKETGGKSLAEVFKYYIAVYL